MIISVFFFFTPSASAQVVCPFPGCFGGKAVSAFFCPCSANYIIYFSPLYLYPSSGPVAGGLIFQPGTMKYLNYNIIPSEGVIGSYMPGVQNCWIPVTHGCALYTVGNLGQILPDTGSSLPGGG